jgi:hypothetical protein
VFSNQTQPAAALSRTAPTVKPLAG